MNITSIAVTFDDGSIVSIPEMPTETSPIETEAVPETSSAAVPEVTAPTPTEEVPAVPSESTSE